jgi:tripartite-type tricarboxylate transporter receptor subunit TctC
MSGQVQVIFSPVSSSLEYVKAGNLRALAVTTATRSPLLPNVPAVAEFVPGYEASAWYGIAAPKKTPVNIIDKLNNEINAGLADPKLIARLAELGSSPFVGSPSDFANYIAEQTEKWAKVVAAAHIKAE